MCCSCAALQYTMKSLALILGLLAAVQAAPGVIYPMDVAMPVIEGAPVPIAPKIVGGNPGNPSQFPHHAALVVSGSFRCSGSLIARDWILTAAHCTPGTSFTVILGRSQWAGTGGVSVAASQRIIHAGFNPNNMNNDISLLRLSSQVVLTNNIQPVAMPTAGDASNTFGGVTFQVSGFGSPNGLLTSIQSLISHSPLCTQNQGNPFGPSHICTTAVGGGSSCIGDSGGALVITRDGGFTQMGVVNYRLSPGCRGGHPSFHLRVTSFRNWIHSHTGV